MALSSRSEHGCEGVWAAGYYSVEPRLTWFTITLKMHQDRCESMNQSINQGYELMQNCTEFCLHLNELQVTFGKNAPLKYRRSKLLSPISLNFSSHTTCIWFGWEQKFNITLFVLHWLILSIWLKWAFEKHLLVFAKSFVVFHNHINVGGRIKRNTF